MSNITYYDSVAVPDLGERLTMANAMNTFSLIKPLIKNYHVAIDLAGVQHVDSSGLGQIVRLWKDSRDTKYSVGIVNPQPHIASLLDLVRISEFVPVYNSMYDFVQECEKVDKLEEA